MNKHLPTKEELDEAFDNGTVFSATPEDINRYIQALGSMGFPNDNVRHLPGVRATVLNHLQMAALIRDLNTSNGRTQKKLTLLTIVALALAAIQAFVAIFAAP